MEKLNQLILQNYMGNPVRGTKIKELIQFVMNEAFKGNSYIFDETKQAYVRNEI